MTQPMLWVGGAPGAGKSTLARGLALAEDLSVHALDLWTYDHAARLPAAPTLDEDLARGPAAAADSFEAQGRLWQRHAGIAALPPFPFACECGTSRCAATWPGTPDAYDARTAVAPLVAHLDATGPGAEA